MAYFPFFIDVQDKTCLIAGGGKVAYRKAKVLLSFGVYITVVSPEICEELMELKQSEAHLVLQKREFELEDLKNAFFVIAATNDPVVNETISIFSLKANVLVNVADSLENSTYLFPSIVRRGDLVAGITTSGKSPDLSKWVRKRMDSILPDYLEELIEELGCYRLIIKERIPSITDRKQAFKEVMYLGMKMEGKLDDEAVEQVIKKYEQ